VKQLNEISVHDQAMVMGQNKAIIRILIDCWHRKNNTKRIYCGRGLRKKEEIQPVRIVVEVLDFCFCFCFAGCGCHGNGAEEVDPSRRVNVVFLDQQTIEKNENKFNCRRIVIALREH